jgi:hypothetical protein
MPADTLRNHESDIFVSYSREDAPRVEILVNALEANDRKVLAVLTLNDADLYPHGSSQSRHPEMSSTITSAAFSAIM